MRKIESPPEIPEEKRTELTQIQQELDQLEREVSARFGLIRRRLTAVLGGMRTAGPKVFELRGPDGKVRVIQIRWLAEESGPGPHGR